ncbi:flagellar hook-associated protein 2 [Orenia metallireducens]|uniref:Flagellar hook-associated protein 2 n=1 Tax=Orenia metallireducens TaxID=1413210 RepID=A0A285GE70_9FIRM|nr:flagellar filament capping protein FliD [Orenia metallireducens]PRX32582.1 flagellar hook-associated protein 2 [Orenia metallireducens]SNY20776.1 flagellar hook-associated protein 2 [Orenia metallireducens]
MAGISLDGLVSGMDTQSVIDKLMYVEQRPLIQMQDKKEDLRVAKDAWRDVNSRLDSLSNKITDLKFSSTFNSNKTTSSDEEIATATANTSASAGSYALNISNLAKANRVASRQDSAFTTAAAETFTIDIKDGTGTSMVSNTATISVGAGASLSEISEAINNTTVDHDGDSSTEEINIAKASVVDGRLVIESYHTGSDYELALTDDTGLLADLGFNLDADGKVTGPADGAIDSASESGVLQAGENAEFTIDGLGVSRSTNEDIDDVVDNVKFDLKAIGEATIDVGPDVEKTVTAVQDFIDQYNSVQGFISDKMDYDSDSGESGALQGDSTLMRLSSRLRQGVTDRVNETDKYNQLAMVGIEIDKDGKMSLDEDEFKAALDEDPAAVEKLFNADSEDSDSFDGVATRLDNYLDMLLKTNTGVIPKRIDSYESMMKDVDDNMDSLERRLEMKRESLKEQFTAMEKGLSEINSQSSWLQSQLGSLGSI